MPMRQINKSNNFQAFIFIISFKSTNLGQISGQNQTLYKYRNQKIMKNECNSSTQNSNSDTNLDQKKKTVNSWNLIILKSIQNLKTSNTQVTV